MDDTIKLDLILRQQKAILEELRVLKSTVATSGDVLSLSAQIKGLYDAYTDMARGSALALGRIQDLDERLMKMEAPP